MSKMVSFKDRGRSRSNDRVQRPDFQERRQNARRASSDRLFVQVVQSDDESKVGHTIACRALDVSANGLRIRLDQEILVGSVLDLWVDDSRKPGKFFLTSEVRWTAPSGPDSFFCGVQLHDGSATDVEAWRSRQQK
jgi:hypothetical protein